MRIWIACAAAAVAATTLTACGASNHSGGTASAGSSPAAASNSGGGSGHDYAGSYGGGGSSTSSGGGTAVTVDETEFHLALSTTTFTPGTYTFTAKNDGQASHDLVIEGPGVGEKKSDTVSPGKATSLTVTLQKGSYELYCAIANHKSLGMKTTITVG